MSLKCKIGLHAWDGCKCIMCGKTKDEQHSWDGCKCSKCGKKRDDKHRWNGCKCYRCDKTRDEQHIWSKDCEKCSKCGKKRDNQHSWDGCKCNKCNKTRDEQHLWDGCKCSKCEKNRDDQHSWDGCKCSKCSKTVHLWDGLKCTKCESKRDNLAFTDERDGHIYKYKKIGKLFWMVENLSFKVSNGCYVYDNKESNLIKFGYLYNWKTANSCCPKGWHLPSSSEVIQLTEDTGSNIIGKFGVVKPEVKKFNPLLGGIRLIDGNFNALNERSNFWTSTEIDDNMAYFFYYAGTGILCYFNDLRADKRYGYYIRCCLLYTSPSPRD